MHATDTTKKAPPSVFSSRLICLGSLLAFWTITLFLYRFYSLGGSGEQIFEAQIRKDHVYSAVKTFSANSISRLSSTALKKTPAPTQDKVAYAITLTSPGNYLDGAAVLAKSIEVHHTGKYEYDLLAILHESATSLKTQLLKIGYKVIVVPTPIDVKDIQNRTFARDIQRDGCCGERELIKLEVYRQNQYKKVMLLDADMIFMQPMPELFNNSIEFQFLFDYGSGALHENREYCVQGGVMVVEPNVTVYEEIRQIVLEGDYRGKTGWRGAHLGQCYGGRTIQGVLSYYYAGYAKGQHTRKELDHCRVGGMLVGFYNAQRENCARVNVGSIKLFHFTGGQCNKPWQCRSQQDNQNCGALVKQWWKFRNMLAKENHLPELSSEEACKSGSYSNLFNLE